MLSLEDVSISIMQTIMDKILQTIIDKSLWEVKQILSTMQKIIKELEQLEAPLNK